MSLSNRGLKTLRRIHAGKSVPDIGALDELERKGYLVMTYPPDEITLTITKMGNAYLRHNPPVRSCP